MQLGRSIIALGQLVTLALTSWLNLSTEVLSVEPATYCAGVRRASLFCLGSETPQEFGRWIGIVIAALVIAGAFPRILAVAHLWLALSMNISLSLPDGGESVAVFATAFLVLIELADRRRLGWCRAPAESADLPRSGPRAISYAGSLALCIQLAGIYFESGLAKLAVSEWVDGSAMFYVTRDPMFGTVGWVGDILQALTMLPAGAALLTWGTIAVECTIAVLLLLPSRYKRYALLGVVPLHLGIGVAMGLWSFAATMIGTALIATYSLADPTHPHTEGRK
ncbi:hypothetical protein [Mycetocola saprophilus]|uniref:hypothetical protein n=1 Tax=Mycetocola saprophilus TaxID=76636 RepID=UPI00068D4C8F|nr:hypothetical protein [Mycetocola saprophilus]